MRQKTLWVAAIMLVASAAIGLGLDSPDGEPPHGLDFADGRSGTQLVGLGTVLFQGVTTDAKAQRYDAVVRLRKGGSEGVYEAGYSCSGTDTCGICTGGLIDMTLLAGIQHCIENQIQPDVLADFAPAAVDLRLRDLTTLVNEPFPGFVVLASDVEFTAK